MEPWPGLGSQGVGSGTLSGAVHTDYPRSPAQWADATDTQQLLSLTQGEGTTLADSYRETTAMREGQGNLGSSTASPMLPALVLEGFSLSRAAAKSEVPCQAQAQVTVEERGSGQKGWSPGGATLLWREAPGPAGKPAYLERWHSLEIGH